MDTDLAHTFLEVIGAGSFVAAARRLNVTQSTVSARIALLEEKLGSRLFLRGKGGAVLTPAGVRFLRPAAAMVRIWEQAQQDAMLPSGYRAALRIGGEAGLWDRWLHRWVPWMRTHAPDIALRCEAGAPDGLARSLVEGVLDLAVLYSPQTHSGLKSELLVEEELVLLEADPPPGADHAAEHVYVDWGEEFRYKHRISFPDFSSPIVLIGWGSLGLDYLLEHGGRGYFPRRLAPGPLASGRVRLVLQAETFRLPAYAAYPVAADPRELDRGLAGLRAIAAQQREGTE